METDGRKIIAKIVETEQYDEDGERFGIKATALMSQFGKQSPYFSITGWESGGCTHAEIAKRLPRLQPLIKWHLCSITGTPMHYLANALYWASKVGKPKQNTWDPDAMEAFKSTVVWGACPSFDRDEALPRAVEPGDAEAEQAEKERVKSLLEARLPSLQKDFRKTMQDFGLL